MSFYSVQHPTSSCFCSSFSYSLGLHTCEAVSQAAWIASLPSPAIDAFLCYTYFFPTTLSFCLVIPISCLSLQALWGCSLNLREFKMVYNSNYAMQCFPANVKCRQTCSRKPGRIKRQQVEFASQ